MKIVGFKTPVVREMTHDEYREQRRRVIASLVKTDTRALPAPRVRA